VIALLGNLSRDLDPVRRPRVGGGPFHGARALQRLRVPARVVARCAASDRDELMPPVIRLGTPARWVPGASTATFSISYDGDARTMHVEALGDRWRPADVPELPAVRWIHVAPLFRGEFPLETVAALALRRRVSFDAQGLVRVPELGPLRLDADFDPELLRHIWVLKMADEEAEVLGDPRDLGVREAVVTHGSRGSTVYCGLSTFEIPAHRLDVDPTGAGDAFATAYVVARNTGSDPAGAARRATAVVAAMLAR
jgi:sugar/nucleoside kinase (ribokinase family)